MNELKEPILCAPNDPDDARLLSEVCEGWEAEHMDEVTILFWLKIDLIFRWNADDSSYPPSYHTLFRAFNRHMLTKYSLGHA